MVVQSRVVIVLLIAVLCLNGCSRTEKTESKKPESQATLLGTWEVILVEEDGKRIEPLPKEFLIITTENVTRRIERKPEQIGLTSEGVRAEPNGDYFEISFSYEADLTKKPQTIDLTPPKASSNLSFKGIILLSEDRLTLCYRYGNSPDRPTEFTAKAGEKSTVYTCKRIKY